MNNSRMEHWLKRSPCIHPQGLRQRRLRELEGDEDTTIADEGEEREAWLLQIQLAGARAADTLDVLRQVRGEAASA